MRVSKLFVVPFALGALGLLATGAGAQTSFANDDEATTPQGVAVAIDVLANDDIPDDPFVFISFFDYGDASHGSLSADDGVVTYTPDPGFSGDDTFNYGVCYDSEQGIDQVVNAAFSRRATGKTGPSETCDSATVTIRVLAPPATTTTTVAPTTVAPTTVAIAVVTTKAPTTTTPPTTAAAAAAAELPRTGGGATNALPLGLGALALGGVALGLSRRRSHQQ